MATTTDKFTIIEHKIIPVGGTSNISLVSSFAKTLTEAEAIANASTAPFVEIKDTTGTQVFTKNGWVNIESVNINDEIYTLDLNTNNIVVNSYVGNKYTIISSSSNGKGVGEYGIHVQDGNMDTQLDNGQYRVASAKDMTFISTTKITIQVGTSSIVMEPGKITITSADVEFVKA